MWPTIQWPTSKKARAFLAVLAFLVLATTVLALRREKELPPAAENTKSSLEQQRLRLTGDKDNDGLKDWEETIYGTSPSNPDTDGDNTTDGEEIHLGRDPLKKGPDDKLVKAAETQAPEEQSTTNNLTQNLANKFGERFLAERFLSSSGKPDLGKLSGQIVAEALNSTGPAPAKFFSIKDIIVIPSANREQIQKYQNSLVAVVAGTFQGLDTPEIVIFSEALKADNLSSLSRLEPYLAAYDSLLSQLKKLAAPSDLAALHIEYLNNVKQQKEAVLKMRRAELDIVQALNGAQEYASVVADFQTLVTKFQQKLRNLGIFS